VSALTNRNTFEPNVKGKQSGKKAGAEPAYRAGPWSRGGVGRKKRKVKRSNLTQPTHFKRRARGQGNLIKGQIVGQGQRTPGGSTGSHIPGVDPGEGTYIEKREGEKPSKKTEGGSRTDNKKQRGKKKRKSDKRCENGRNGKRSHGRETRRTDAGT